MNDKFTQILSKIINTIFLYNIIGTSMGCLVGIFILSLQDLIGTYFPIFLSIKWYGFIVFGIIIFNIAPLNRRKYEDPKIETGLKYIKKMIDEGNFSKADKKEIWREVITNTVNYFLKNTDDNKEENDNSATV